MSFVEYFCDRRVCARRQGGAGDVLFGTAQDVRSPVDDFAASVITQIHQQQIVGRELPLNSVDSPSALLQCILVPSNSISTCQVPDSGEPCREVVAFSRVASLRSLIFRLATGPSHKLSGTWAKWNLIWQRAEVASLPFISLAMALGASPPPLPPTILLMIWWIAQLR